MNSADDVIDHLTPQKPSGYNGHCRSALSMAADAANLGLSALVPPVVGAAVAVGNAVMTAKDRIANGDIGAAAGALASSVPAVAAGFFGGGAAADAAQGLTNEALTRAGANADNLPQSSTRNLVQDATCKKEPEASAPKINSAPISLTDNLPKTQGKPRSITPAEQAKLNRLTMPALY